MGRQDIGEKSTETISHEVRFIEILLGIDRVLQELLQDLQKSNKMSKVRG
jgi:hypothetical protein